MTTTRNPHSPIQVTSPRSGEEGTKSAFDFERTLQELAAARIRYEDLQKKGAGLGERVSSLQDLHDLRARMVAYFRTGE